MSPGFEILRTANSVDFWIDRRLPFEPRGDLLGARNELRASVRVLECGADDVLIATYTSLDTSSCDAENVLLYNVGMSCFVNAMRRGVQFERRYALPPTTPTGQPYRHHHSYRFIKASDLAVAEQRYIFEFPLNRISSSINPHHIWWAASAVKPALAEPISGPFELDIQIPATVVRTNLSAVVKCIIDGIICALHNDPEFSNDAVLRLAAATGWDAMEIANRLCTEGRSILSERTVLRVYRNFVKWNPADDLCNRCTIILHGDEMRGCVVSIGAYWPSANSGRERVLSDVAQAPIDFAAGKCKVMTAHEIVREASSKNQKELPMI